MLRATAKFMTSSSHRQALLRHLSQYAELAATEAELATSHAVRRGVYAGLAMALMVVALTLAGVALMLAQTVVADGWQGAPMLWVVPTGVALMAIVLTWLALSSSGSPPFEGLRAQLSADAEVMRDVFGDHSDAQALAPLNVPSDVRDGLTAQTKLERADREERDALATLAERMQRAERFEPPSTTSASSTSRASVVVS